MPTLGTVSTNGVFRISRSFDGIGAMAKTAADLAILVESLLRPDVREKLTETSFESATEKGWEGLRVGITESTWGVGNKEKWNVPAVVSSSSPLRDSYSPTRRRNDTQTWQQQFGNIEAM